MRRGTSLGSRAKLLMGEVFVICNLYMCNALDRTNPVRSLVPVRRSFAGNGLRTLQWTFSVTITNRPPCAATAPLWQLHTSRAPSPTLLVFSLPAAYCRRNVLNTCTHAYCLLIWPTVRLNAGGSNHSQMFGYSISTGKLRCCHKPLVPAVTSLPFLYVVFPLLSPLLSPIVPDDITVYAHCLHLRLRPTAGCGGQLSVTTTTTTAASTTTGCPSPRDPPSRAGQPDRGAETMELRDFRARLMSKGLDGWGAAAGEGKIEGSTAPKGSDRFVCVRRRPLFFLCLLCGHLRSLSTSTHPLSSGCPPCRAGRGNVRKSSTYGVCFPK